MGLMSRDKIKLDWDNVPCLGDGVMTSEYSTYNAYRMFAINQIFYDLSIDYFDRVELVYFLETLIQALTPINIKRKNKWNKI